VAFITHTGEGVLCTVPRTEAVRATVASVFADAQPEPGERYEERLLKLATEVREPAERWIDVLERAIGHLAAGVAVVIILDPATESASVFRSDTRQQTFEKDQTLTVEDVLPGFAVPVARFFEE
jgi:Uma2 family endonuclease